MTCPRKSRCLSGAGAQDGEDGTGESLQALVRVCSLPDGQAVPQLFEVMVPFETLRKAADSVCRKCLCTVWGVLLCFSVFYSFGRVLFGQGLPLGSQRGRLHEVRGRTGLRGADEPSFGDESEVPERRQANLSSAGS